MRIRSRRTPGGTIFDVCNYGFLLLFALSILYPFWTIIVQSFAPMEEATSMGLHVWNRHWKTDSWLFVFRNSDMVVAYLNTIYRVVVGTVLILCTTFTAAYVLSKKDLPGRGAITLVYLFTMFFSGGLIPTYMLIKGLGLINNRLVLVLPGMVHVFYIVIARNFLMTIDQAMEEAAMMEGAGYFTVLVRIMLPLSKPVLATIALWAAVGHWNAWFDALLYTSRKEFYVLQMIIMDMLRKLNTTDLEEFADTFPEMGRIPAQSVQAATILFTIGPIILIYPFVQKFFVKGVMVGSLKG
jgi:putative aldouronate transport system permease protein